MGEGNNNKQRQSSEQFSGYLLHKLIRKLLTLKLFTLRVKLNLRKIELGIPCVIFR